MANRVSQIRDSEFPLTWRHVPGEMNPADVASRGCRAHEIVDHPLWWGPRWLALRRTEWPPNPVVTSPKLESRTHVNVTVSEPELNAEFLLGRYSSLDKLVNVTAWIFRFARNCRTAKGQRRQTAFLAPAERDGALTRLIKSVQVQHFGQEMDLIVSGRSKLKGAIVRLNPFVDSRGLLRVGGRLRNADLPYSVRHPLLLPRGGPLVELLVMDRHIKMHMQGAMH